MFRTSHCMGPSLRSCSGRTTVEARSSVAVVAAPSPLGSAKAIAVSARKGAFQELGNSSFTRLATACSSARCRSSVARAIRGHAFSVTF